VQCATWTLILTFAIELFCDRQRVRINFDYGVDHRAIFVDVIHAVEILLHERARSELARRHTLLQF
jgi:hypothetical protein